MDRSNDTWHRLLVKFTLSGVEKHGVWAGSEEEAKALAKAEMESNYPSFNIDNIEFIDEKQEETNNEVNQAQMRQMQPRKIFHCQGIETWISLGMAL